MATILNETIFYLKISNFLEDNKHHNFVQSIEFHCVLKNIKHDYRHFNFTTILPFPKSSLVKKNEFLFICNKEDTLFHKVSAIIDDKCSCLVEQKMIEYNCLVHGYIRKHLGDQEPLLDRHIFGICLNFYFSKEHWKREMAMNSLEHFGIEIKTMDQLRAANNDAHSKGISRRKYCGKLLKERKWCKIFASVAVMRRIPRLIGPNLGRIGLFPSVMDPRQDPKIEMDNNRRKVSLKYRHKQPVLSCVIGDSQMDKTQLIANILGLMNGILCNIVRYKDNTKSKRADVWSLIKKINVKFTHGNSVSIYRDNNIVAKDELPKLVRRYKYKKRI
eukprot:114394_1